MLPSTVLLPSCPHEARNLRLPTNCLAPSKNASSLMRHPAEAEGNSPQRLPGAKRELPS